MAATALYRLNFIGKVAMTTMLTLAVVFSATITYFVLQFDLNKLEITQAIYQCLSYL